MAVIAQSATIVMEKGYAVLDKKTLHVGKSVAVDGEAVVGMAVVGGPGVGSGVKTGGGAEGS